MRNKVARSAVHGTRYILANRAKPARLRGPVGSVSGARMHRLGSLLPVATEGTVLRRFQKSDLERFHAYRSDPQLAIYQGWSPMSLQEAKQFVEDMTNVDGLRAGDWIQLAIAEASSSSLIGDIGLFLEADGSTAEVGFTLCREAHGRVPSGRANAQGAFAGRPHAGRRRRTHWHDQERGVAARISGQARIIARYAQALCNCARLRASAQTGLPEGRMTPNPSSPRTAFCVRSPQSPRDSACSSTPLR